MPRYSAESRRGTATPGGQALAAKGYTYQFVFARNAKHCDRSVKAQLLPEALAYLWRGYPSGS